MRKIPVERRNISRAEMRGKFSLKTGIFRKYASQYDTMQIFHVMWSIYKNIFPRYLDIAWMCYISRRQRRFQEYSVFIVFFRNVLTCFLPLLWRFNPAEPVVEKYVIL